MTQLKILEKDMRNEVKMFWRILNIYAKSARGMKWSSPRLAYVGLGNNWLSLW